MQEKLIGLHVQITASLHKRVKLRAAADGVKLKAVVVAALERYLKEREEEKH